MITGLFPSSTARMKPLVHLESLVAFSLVLITPEVPVQELGAPQAPSAWETASLAAAAGGDLDGAVLIIEEHLEEYPEDARAHRAHARALERMVLEGGGTWLAMTDARGAWDRALALEPFSLESVRGAVDIRTRLGEYEEAAALALRAVGTAALELGETPREMLALALRCRVRAYQNARDLGMSESLARAKATLRAIAGARRMVPDASELARIEGEFIDWLGHPEVAAKGWSEALRLDSTDSALHRAFIDLHLRQGVEERLPRFYVELGADGMNATLAWYTGYAARLEGDLGLRERRHDDARDAYERAERWMEVAATLNPEFAFTADQIRHQAGVSLAWCDVDAREDAEARTRLLGLLRTAPERRHERDGLGRTVLQALSVLGERAVQQNDFQTAAADAQVVVEMAPDEGEWWNNLGFLLREYATQIEGGAYPEFEDPKSGALEVYRQSWKAYREAAERIPEDVRVVNDAALIQVYHVREELELAETMLRESAARGEAQLADLGPNPDEAERFPIAMAVGDAYQNLGYLYYHVLDRPQEARPFLVSAMESNGGDRSGLGAYLASIDGNGEAVAERDSVSQVSPPRGPIAPARLVWESSLADARARARTEGRPLIIYYRGAGLGLGVAFYDMAVRGEVFPELTRGAVLLVCDKVRRTYRDRRRDGRRILAPNWGSVTCGEHIAAANEFDVWYEELTGEAPGEEAEGLHLWTPATDELRAISLPELPGLERPATASWPSFEAQEAALSGASGRAQARELVRTRTRRARDLVERIVWGGFHEGSAREHLVRALAEDEDPGSRELLAACVRQTLDPPLSGMALACWPGDADLDPVWFAARWARTVEVRTAAWEVLSRRATEDLAVAARTLFED